MNLRSYRVYLVIQFATSMLLNMAYTVFIVYQVEAGHLNPFELVITGTVLEATSFVFQVPTGIVADVYSRRLSVISGTLLIGVGIFLSGLIPVLALFLISQVVAGIGYTLVDGAMEAWVADELGEEHAGAAYLRGAQAWSAGSLAGIGISTALAAWILNLPIILGGIGLVLLAAWLVWKMPENGFKPTPRENRNSWQMMMHTFSRGLRLARARPVVLTILAIAVLQGAFSEGFDRLWTPHLLNEITLPPLGPLAPVVWFGLIRGAGVILSLAANEVIRRRLDTNAHASVARALLAVTATLTFGVLTFALTANLAVALVAFLVVSPARNVWSPVSAAWLNQSLEPQVRATLFSVNSQMDALGQMVGGPILGAIATGVSTPIAISAAALLLLPVLLMYGWTIGRPQALAESAGTE